MPLLPCSLTSFIFYCTLQCSHAQAPQGQAPLTRFVVNHIPLSHHHATRVVLALLTSFESGGVFVLKNGEDVWQTGVLRVASHHCWCLASLDVRVIPQDRPSVLEEHRLRHDYAQVLERWQWRLGDSSGQLVFERVKLRTGDDAVIVVVETTDELFKEMAELAQLRIR